MKQYQINEHAIARETKFPHGSTEIGVYVDEIMIGVILHATGSSWWSWYPVGEGKKIRYRTKRGAIEKASTASRAFEN